MTNLQPTMLNSYTPGAADLPAEDAALIARRQAALGPAYRLFYQKPLHVVSARDVWLTGADGTRYLDSYNNVVSVGHCHPHVVDAIARQSATLCTHTRYLTDPVVDYAERLLATMPAGLTQVMFTCTGSEANDLALRIAFVATGNTGIIITENAYHGTTHLIAGLSPSLGPGVEPYPHVRHVPAPIHGDGKRFAADVTAAIADMAAAGIRPAALLVDTIFTSDGVAADPPGFLIAAADVIRAAGGLFIADEVQPGFGRSGAGLWNIARHGIAPDILTMGKPMGNGYPVAGLAIRPELTAGFGAKARYFNTFGGNTVAMAAAGAVLDVIESEGLIANAARVGNAFATALDALPSFGPVRHAGLMIAVDLLDGQGAPDAPRCLAIVNGLRDHGVLVSASSKEGHSLKIRPPLTFSMEHVDYFMDRLGSVLKTL